MENATRSQEKKPLMAKIVAILLLTFLLLLTILDAVQANSNDQQPETYLQRPNPNGRPQLMVAIYCGPTSGASKSISLYHNQFLEIDTKKWRTDRNATAFCTQDKKEVLNYCRSVYPNHDIRNIVESSRLYKIDNWCRLGSPKRKCRTRLTVKPYRCLEGTFQSDALLVPERCVFDHVHNKSVCGSSQSWNQTATENCHSKAMRLQSFAMLQPCGLDVFSGVEFVCCPHGKHSEDTRTKGSSSEGNSFAQATNAMSSSSSSSSSPWPKYELDEKFNNIRTDDEVLKKHTDFKSDNQDDQDDSDVDEEEEEDEYEDEEDEYDDDSSSWNNDKSSSTSTTTTTTTTTTERPIDHYLSHFDLAHEHDDFRKAEIAVEGSYRDKITHVMKDWSQLDSHYEDMKKTDPVGAEEFKKKMTYQFQKTIEALEEEGAAQRHQLASMHAERAMAIINRRKKAAMDCLTQALDKIPIRTRQVERCIVKLLKALEKDRSHTLRQYKNLLNLNTREALREKKIILEHLVTLNRAANQSIAMLDRSPILVEKLKNKIVVLWHKLRGVPMDEPIVRESELKTMEKYEEEVAQRKIERERQKMVEQQEAQAEHKKQEQQEITSKAQESLNGRPSDNNDFGSSSNKLNYGPATSTTAAPRVGQDITSAPAESTAAPVVRQEDLAATITHPATGPQDVHYEAIAAAKFSHLRAADSSSSHHELSAKSEPLVLSGGQMERIRFGYPSLLLSTCALIIVLAFFGVRHYTRNSNRAYRRQGFAEVGRACPEERNVTSMQFNGYENPAYKFFEAEA